MRFVRVTCTRVEPKLRANQFSTHPVNFLSFFPAVTYVLGRLSAPTLSIRSGNLENDHTEKISLVTIIVILVKQGIAGEQSTVERG